MVRGDMGVPFVTVQSRLPLRTSGVRLYWDRGNTVTSVWVSMFGHRVEGQENSAGGTASACMTFYPEISLLLNPEHAGNPHITRTMLWLRQPEPSASIPQALFPALVMQAASPTGAREFVEVVAHLPQHDPLFHNIALVVQAVHTATKQEEYLYAEALTHALALHFLHRYRATQVAGWMRLGGLTPARLQRILAYIRAHLEKDLSLATLATVAQSSPKHFAGLFKQAMGRTPHQYVLWCRMERAQQLLVETKLALCEIAYQVGCADQSHFTSLFRRHVGMTPKAYRATRQRVSA